MEEVLGGEGGGRESLYVAGQFPGDGASASCWALRVMGRRVPVDVLLVFWAC